MKKTLLLTFVVLSCCFSAAAQHGLKVTWTPSSTSGVTSQTLYRATAPGAEVYGTPLVTFANNTTNNYLDTTGLPGITYYYTAEAWINTINSNPSVEASGLFPTVPVAPTAITVTAGRPTP